MHRSLKRSTSRATPRALLASVEQRLTRAAGERLRSGTPSCPFEFQAGAWWLSCVVAALASLANYPSRLCCRAQAGIGSRAHGSGGNSSGAHSSALDSHCPREVQVLRRTCQTRGGTRSMILTLETLVAWRAEWHKQPACLLSSRRPCASYAPASSGKAVCSKP